MSTILFIIISSIIGGLIGVGFYFLTHNNNKLNQDPCKIKTGAQWQKKHVWHNASEEPDMDASIVTLYDGNIVSTTRRKYVRGMKEWNPEKWCYLNDILPTS